MIVCPRWVYSCVQPIAVNDVLDHLAAALANAASGDKVIEIGGEEVTTYWGMMLGYARAWDLRHWLVFVPVLTPRLSSYWVHWITPIPSGVSGPLIEGPRNEVVVTDGLARELFPAIAPRDYGAAIAGVIDDLEHGRIETAWSDAYGASEAPDSFTRVESHEGMIFERRTWRVDASAREVYRVFTGIGGDRGWFHGDWMWRIRGAVDRLLGGVELRQGRRHRRVALRQRAGFLTGGGAGARPHGPPSGGDEAAGPRLAPVPGVGDGRRQVPAGADRCFSSQGLGRTALLVRRDRASLRRPLPSRYPSRMEITYRPSMEAVLRLRVLTAGRRSGDRNIRPRPAEPRHVRDDQWRVLQCERVLPQLVKCRVQVRAPPLVLPGEAAALPHVGPAVAAAVLPRRRARSSTIRPRGRRPSASARLPTRTGR